MNPGSTQPKIVPVLARGLARRCPHCGEAPLFAKWFTLRKRCEVCGLRFEQSAGDTWALWILGDRVFVAAVIILLFFVFPSNSWSSMGLVLLLVAVPLFWTMPHRMGVCLAVDYLTRVYWGDASEVPDLSPSGPEDRRDSDDPSLEGSRGSQRPVP